MYISIPSYAEAMAFGDRTSTFRDRDGNIKTWKINNRLCNLARSFHGDYKWQGTIGFKVAVRKDANYRGEFWGETLHGLGATHQEIFNFFTAVMNDPNKYNFSSKWISTLVDFWVDQFREQLELIGETKLAARTDYDLAQAYYWTIANTVQGLLDEVETFENLKEMFKNDSSIVVKWAADADENKDIDVVIYKDGNVYHKASVKSEHAFSKSCITQYRKDWGKMAPTLYVDKYLNRIFFKKDTNEVLRTVLEFGGEERVKQLTEQWRGVSML
jgi:hypothetical protein